MPVLIAGDRTRLPIQSDEAIVGRHSADGKDVPDVDLADLEGGRTVSRRHARIFTKGGNWFLVADPSSTNPTVVDGKTLAAGETVLLKDGDGLRLGRVELVFRAADPLAPNAGATVVHEDEAPAEIRYGKQTFPLNDGAAKPITVGRHSDDRTYRPDVDLGDLPNGHSVSRRNGRIYRRDGAWYLQVEPDVTNPVLIDGRKVAPGSEVPLQDGTALQFGNVPVTFHLGPVVHAATDELLELIVSPPTVPVDPGSEATVTATVINHTGLVDWFKVEVEGLPANWYKIVPADGTIASPDRIRMSDAAAEVRLFHTPAHAAPAADAVAKLKIVFAPPRDCSSRAGLHPFAVSATSQGEPPQRRAVAGQLTVREFDAMGLEVGPREIRGTRGAFDVVVSNRGNHPARAVLGVPPDGLVYTWEPAEVTGGVSLGNCAAQRARALARPRRRHWLGPDKAYPIAITARVGAQTQSQTATLVVPPRIPLWLQQLFNRVAAFLQPILMIAAILGLLLAAFLVFLRVDIKAFQPDSPDKATVVEGSTATLNYQVDGAVASVEVSPPPVAPPPGQPLNPKQGQVTVKPSAANPAYTLTAKNRLGIFSQTKTFRFTVVPPPPVAKVDSFTAQPLHIPKEGQPVVLSWQTEGAQKVEIDQQVTVDGSPTTGPVDEITAPQPSGTGTVHPKAGKTVYVIKATPIDPSQQPVQSTVEVDVDPPTVLTFTPSASTLIQGQDLVLRWAAQNATQLTLKVSEGEIEPGKGSQEDLPPDQTSLTLKPTQAGDLVYTLTASNAGGPSAPQTVQVTVAPFQISFFKADPPSIAKGQSATLSWNVPGAKSLSLNPGGAIPDGETSLQVSPDKTTDYTLHAVGPDGKTAKDQKITVTVTAGAVKVDFVTPAPATIVKGDQATISFSVQNATTVVVQTADGQVVKAFSVPPPPSPDQATTYQGSVTVSPPQTTTYVVKVSNSSGEQDVPAVVNVTLPTPTAMPTAASAGAAGGGGGGGGAGGGGGGPTPTPGPKKP